MKIECTLKYYFFYYPSKRSKKLRYSCREKKACAEIKEIMADEAGIAAFLPDASYINFEGKFYVKKRQVILKKDLASRISSCFTVRDYSVEYENICRQIPEKEMAAVPEELIDREATKQSFETVKARMKEAAERYLIVCSNSGKYDDIAYEAVPEPYIYVEKQECGRRDITIEAGWGMEYLDPVYEYRLSDAPLILKKYHDLSKRAKEELNNVVIVPGGEKFFSYPFRYGSKIDGRYEYNRAKGAYSCNLICYEDLSEYKGDESWKITFVQKQEGWEFWEREAPCFDDIEKYVCEVRCVKSKSDALAAFFKFNPSVPFKNVGKIELINS